MDDRPLGNRIVFVMLSILGVVLLLQLVTASTGDVEGSSAPDGSSFSTGPGGHKALRLLLEANGFATETARIEYAEVPPDPTATVLVIGGSRLSSPDQRALSDFVAAGGRLLAVGIDVGEVIGEEPTASRSADTTHTVLIPYPGFGSITEYAVPSGIVWDATGPVAPIGGADRDTSVGTIGAGAGEVWTVSDASILANEALDRLDNAALALALAGDPARTVVFTEYTHGYGPATGIASLPTRWQAALWLGAIAGVVWMFSRGRRLGPPERRVRRLAPPRVAYVDALAASLTRTDEPAAATEPVRRRIRSELQRRGAEDAGGIARVANQLNVTPAEIEEAMRPPEGDAEAIAAGRVLALLSRNRI